MQLVCMHRDVVEKLLDACEASPDLRCYGYLFLFAYTFLLRLPSEGLPATKGKFGGTSRLFRDGDTIVLELQRRQDAPGQQAKQQCSCPCTFAYRKNRPAGSRLVRKCWCSQSKARRLFPSYLMLHTWPMLGRPCVRPTD